MFAALCALTFVPPGFAAADPPDSESDEFIFIYEKKTSVETFNYQDINPYDVDVSGIDIVIQPGYDKNGLYETYNGRTDVQIFNLHAETVTIRGRFCLPGSMVRIFCDTLVIEDYGGVSGQLDVTPPSLTGAAGEAGSQVDGEDGLVGGTICLWVNNFEDPGDGVIRFVMNGGDGQIPAPGADGADGESMDVCDESYPATNSMPDGTVYLYKQNTDASITVLFGTESWPGDGEDAVAGGKPGAGGDGGYLYTSIADLDDNCIFDGGFAANAADYVYGGAAGQPNPAYWVRYKENQTNGSYQFVTSSTSTQTDGEGASSSEADNYYGESGYSVSLANGNQGFYPLMAEAIVAYAEALIAAEQCEEADALLTEYIVLHDQGSWDDLTWAEEINTTYWRVEMAELLEGECGPPTLDIYPSGAIETPMWTSPQPVGVYVTATDSETNSIAVDFDTDGDGGTDQSVSLESGVQTYVELYFDLPGVYDVTATATDGEGQTGTASRTVTVNAPDVTLQVITPEEGGTIYGPEDPIEADVMIFAGDCYSSEITVEFDLGNNGTIDKTVTVPDDENSSVRLSFEEYGAQTVAVSAYNDAGGTGGPIVRNFNVQEGNSAPRLTVNSPDSGYSVEMSKLPMPVPFAVTANDRETTALILTAYYGSSFYSEAIESGVETEVEIFFSEVGDHTVYLMATDADGLTCESVKRTITIEPPQVTLSVSYPAEGDEIALNLNPQDIGFIVTASDAVSSSLDIAIDYESDGTVDCTGSVANGISDTVAAPFTAVGSWNATVTASNSYGAESDPVSVSFETAPAELVVAVTDPAYDNQGAVFVDDPTSVTMTVRIDNNLTVENELTVDVDRDGTPEVTQTVTGGESAEVVVPFTAAGIYNISFAASNSQGQENTPTIRRFHVGAGPPALAFQDVAWVTPDDGETVIFNDPSYVIYNFLATDPEADEVKIYVDIDGDGANDASAYSSNYFNLTVRSEDVDTAFDRFLAFEEAGGFTVEAWAVEPATSERSESVFRTIYLDADSPTLEVYQPFEDVLIYTRDDPGDLYLRLLATDDGDPAITVSYGFYDMDGEYQTGGSLTAQSGAGWEDYIGGPGYGEWNLKMRAADAASRMSDLVSIHMTIMQTSNEAQRWVIYE